MTAFGSALLLSSNGNSVGPLVLSSNASVEPGQLFPAALSRASLACLPGQAVLDDFHRKWFSEHLRAAKEKPLTSDQVPADTLRLRFLWLRSFHAPVVVRVEGQAGGYRLVAKQLSGAGGYDPGEIDKRLERNLSGEERARLHQLLTGQGFRQMDPRDCLTGMDGAEWVFEEVDPTGYRFVERWSPTAGPARELGAFLLELTGWQFDEVY